METVGDKEEPKKESKPKAKLQPVKQETVIYLGPNFMNGSLITNTTYRNGLPEYIEKLIESHTELKYLFIPVSEINSFNKRVSQVGTLEYRAFNTLRGGK